MKTRKHHNNKGTRRIKTGRCEADVRKIAQKLGIPYDGDHTIKIPASIFFDCLNRLGFRAAPDVQRYTTSIPSDLRQGNLQSIVSRTSKLVHAGLEDEVLEALDRVFVRNLKKDLRERNKPK